MSKGNILAALIIASAALVWVFRDRIFAPRDWREEARRPTPPPIPDLGLQPWRRPLETEPIQRGIYSRNPYLFLCEPDEPRTGVRLVSIPPEFYERYNIARREWESVQIQLAKYPTALRPRKPRTPREMHERALEVGGSVTISAESLGLRRNDEPDTERIIENSGPLVPDDEPTSEMVERAAALGLTFPDREIIPRSDAVFDDSSAEEFERTRLEDELGPPSNATLERDGYEIRYVDPDAMDLSFPDREIIPRSDAVFDDSSAEEVPPIPLEQAIEEAHSTDGAPTKSEGEE
jgi:hypothetical protein